MIEKISDERLRELIELAEISYSCENDIVWQTLPDFTSALKELLQYRQMGAEYTWKQEYDNLLKKVRGAYKKICNSPVLKADASDKVYFEIVWILEEAVPELKGEEDG